VRIRVGARSEVGPVRRRNEDAYLVRKPVFAVADGMGGHRGGNVASSLALEVVERAGPDADLRESIDPAKPQVLRRGESDRELAGMGTTLTAVRALEDAVLLVHVGDSRAYLQREGQLRRLTEDHTLVQQWVNDGRLDAQEAEHHPQRNILTRVLGVEEPLPVDETTVHLRTGDRILLCTDGLTGMVDEARISGVLAQEPDTQAACDALVRMAIEAGGDDNVTVVLLDVEDVEADGVVGDGAAAAGGALAEGGTAASAVAEGTKLEEPSTDEGDARSAVERAEARVGGSIRTPTPKPKQRRPFPWRRVAIWAGAVVVVLVAVFVAGRAYLDRQWYVGDSDGVVAVYRGIPARPLGLSLSHVSVRTDIPTARAERLQPWSGLSGGITADSQQSALNLVAQIRSDIASTGVTTPTTSPSPSPGASPSSSGPGLPLPSPSGAG
jgi:protein phosphatase